ncbi:Retrovirus-related Pol polyprotein LINE-1 [Cricetulus griseus]|uniref:Retrovirus-related Pol polyprotein LINE-1 n=1 Tax=Cricetulus griseus TaxID=10029 RepID=G3HEG8_CRIGR|nr:Retrovirus-related Pol polyprotein LINE-1 [Cricetulus griseus]
MAKIKNTHDSLCWRSKRSKGNTIPLLVEVQTCTTPLWKSVWQFLRKFGINLLQDRSWAYHQDSCSTMFTTALFVIARTWK